jgi:uncharacterized membrane protein
MFQKLSKVYPPILELVPLCLLFIALYLTFSSYSTLPARIPTHFDFQGIPDGWGGKTSFFLYIGFCLFIYILITGISIALTVIRNPKSLINLPESMKAQITPPQAEVLRVFMVRCLWGLKVITLGLITYLIYSNIEVALGHMNNIGSWPMLFTLGIILVVGFMLFRTFRLVFSNRRPV